MGAGPYRQDCTATTAVDDDEPQDLEAVSTIVNAGRVPMRTRDALLLLCALACLAACAQPTPEEPRPDPVEAEPKNTLSLGEAGEQDCSNDPSGAELPCGVVLGPRAAATLMAGCEPEKASPRQIWTPDAAVLAQLDENLSLALRLALGRGGASPTTAPRGTSGPSWTAGLHPDDFRRQYVGIMVEGRRVVHVNGFHKSRLAIEGLRRPELLSWRTEAVLNCRNEPGFFTADYDVSQGRLTGLTLSGGSGASPFSRY